MKPLFIFFFWLFIGVLSYGQQTQKPATQEPKADPHEMTHEMTEPKEPLVKVIQPGAQVGLPPSDAIVLFDGTDITKEWEGRHGSAPKWIVKDVELICGGGSLTTKRKFNDFQLHIEWKTPSVVEGEGQGRGNSGIFLQGQYELQILDSYNNPTYPIGQAGSLYKQYAPLVNVSSKPGEWQVYDIIYTAPRFTENGIGYFTPPRVTVLHNGVLIQNNVSLRGPTLYIGIPEYSVAPHGAGPIALQDHGNPVAFKNIWIREL